MSDVLEDEDEKRRRGLTCFKDVFTNEIRICSLKESLEKAGIGDVDEIVKKCSWSKPRGSGSLCRETERDNVRLRVLPYSQEIAVYPTESGPHGQPICFRVCFHTFFFSFLSVCCMWLTCVCMIV